MNKVFIGLGTNIEPRGERLRRARELLKLQVCAYDGGNWAESPIYETAAWGFTEQAEFLNQVVSFESDKTPQEFLDICKSIEKEMGRQKRDKWREREIDLDLLYCGNEIFASENLTLPHPLISQREFVLKPLCDIAPDFVDPSLKKSVKDMLLAISYNTRCS